MARIQGRSLAGVTMLMLLTTTIAFAQTPTPTPTGRAQQTPPAGRGQRTGGRAALPPITPNMTPQQLQAHIDAYALVQAERQLQLTADQFPVFVGKLRRLQDVRRRHQMERRRMMGELNGLLQGETSGRDEAILEKLRALDDVSQRASGEVRKAFEELDGGLTPWQRGRYRMLEEQLERLKVDMLSKLGTKIGGDR